MAIKKLTSGNDSYTANAGEVVYGLTGNDTITAAAGGSKIYGDTGSDSIVGGVAADTLYGGAGNDTIWGNAGGVGVATADVIYGGDGADSIVAVNTSSTVVEKIFGGYGNDTVAGWTGKGNFDGGAGNDSMAGLAGKDTLTGGDGNDTIAGDTTASLTFDDGGNKLYAGSGNDSVYGSGGTDYILGQAGNDSISAGEGADTVYGGTGNDTIATSIGRDQIHGGDGNDVISSSNTTTTTVVVNGKTIQRDAQTIWGDAGNDSITGGGSDSTIYGGLGTDTLVGGSGNEILNGGAGADSITGNGGTDTVSYLSSAKVTAGFTVAPTGFTIAGAAASFTANGVGAGLSGLAANVGGDAAADTLASVENLTGSAYNDVLWGDTGANTLSGSLGNDTLYGVSGVDSIAGGFGNDMILGNTAGANATMDGGQGIDRLELNHSGIASTAVMVDLANNQMTVGGVSMSVSGFEIVSGGAGTDTLTGATYAGSVNANFTADVAGVVRGNGGADTLNSASFGAGHDILLGDAGNDLYDGTAGSVQDYFGLQGTGNGLNVVLGTGTNFDTIKGFNADGDGDKLWIELTDFGLGTNTAGTVSGSTVATSGAAANAVLSGGWYTATYDSAGKLSSVSLNSSALIQQASGHAATAATTQIIFDQSNGEIWYDHDGNTAAGIAAVKIAVIDKASSTFTEVVSGTTVDAMLNVNDFILVA